MTGELFGHLLLIAGSLGFGVASALIPIINAEAYVLAVCATAKPLPATFAMIALVIGTLAGKLILFMGARHRDQLGRLLHRHGDDVAAAEAGVARAEASAARAEAGIGRAEPGTTRPDVVAGGTAAGPAPVATQVQAPPKRSRIRWPAWMIRLRQPIVDWGDRALGMLDRPWQSFIVLMTSASLGIPPLAITTIAAGLRKTNLPIFIFCVVVGRAIRFGVIAVPTLLARN